MNILLIGDSITDMDRNKEKDFTYSSYGYGYPLFIAGYLGQKYPNRFKIYDRGISGNRIVDLYARIKSDCWELKPDVISILVGVNDVWHEFFPDRKSNGVELDRYEKIFDMLLSDTLKVLPNVKYIFIEPFILHGICTENDFERFSQVKEYAEVVKKLAQKYNGVFIPLQKEFEELANENGASLYLEDGVHPTPVGAKLIADRWTEVFEDKILNGKSL